MVLARLLAAAVLVLCLASPAVATGAPKAKPAASPLALAAAVAGRYWGAVPCRGRVRLLAGQQVPAALSADSGAWVTFASSLGPNDLGAPASSYTDCTIAAARSRWPTAASMREDWDLLCMTVVHEYGHLLGREHEEVAGSVMVPVFSDYAAEPRACRTSRPRR